MSVVGTAFFYSFLLFFLYFTCRLGDKGKSKGMIILAYMTLFIVSSIRYRIGNDYDDYVAEINHICSGIPYISDFMSFINSFEAEPSFAFIVWSLHVFLPVKTYLLVFPAYSFITIFFLYKALDRIKGHAIGLSIYLLAGFMFFSWDGIRQGAALSIVLYAITFVDDRKLFNFIIYILFASLFHFSAIYLLSVCVFRYIKINKWVCVFVITAVLAAFWVGIFNDVVEQMSLVLDYSERYSNYANSVLSSVMFESTNWKIRVSVYALFWISLILALGKGKELYMWMIMIGAIVFILASGALTFYRISLYFSISVILAAPIVFKTKINSYCRWFVLMMLFALFLFFVYDSSNGSYARGCIPYQTIFSEGVLM